MDKWYLTLNYQETKEIIGEKIENIRNNFVEVGFFLKQIRDSKSFEEDGYKSIYEFAQDVYGITRSTASRWMDINDRFSEGGNSPELAAEYREYGKSQLQEMLYLTDEQLENVDSGMTVREIKEIRKPEEEEPVSVLGYPLRVYPEGSVIQTPGCGNQDCFSCHRDGCDLRQQYCYCVEASMGNPFPCTTINVVDMLREEIGSSCQFVNTDLAYHREKYGEPVPCCKKCDNKSTCGYACSRAVKKETVIPEEQKEDVCDVAQTENVIPEEKKVVIPEECNDCYLNGNPQYGILECHPERGEHKCYEADEEETPIDELDLSARTYNCLIRAGIDSVEELQEMSDEELAKIRNFGRMNLDEVHEKLKAYCDTEEQLPGQMEIYDYPEVCPKETDSVAVEECIIPNESPVVENVSEELIEEQTEDSDLDIVRKELDKANKMLNDMLECYTENDFRIRKQKILIGALASYSCDLDDILNPPPVPVQPELPVLKNMEQREQFILNYKTWPVWSKNEETEETYYRYNLPDGSAIVVRCYPRYNYWIHKNDEGKELFLLKEDTKHFKDGETNMTTLKEHLKEVQKHGR